VRESGLKVLVVDANAHIRRLIATLLGTIDGVEIREARTPSLAVARLAEIRPDLVVVDWAGDPVETVLFVHRIRRGDLIDAGTPVLALAAATHHAMRVKAREAGIDEVARKPISAVELTRCAADLLRGRADGLPSFEVEAAE
jgi:DNA-binding response OmpR family regulator